MKEKKLHNEEQTILQKIQENVLTFIIATTYLKAFPDLIVSDNVNSPGTETSCSCRFGPN